VISVEDWAEIRRLHKAESLPVKQIARVMKVFRNTVRAAVRSDGPPRYERAAAGSVADGFEPQIRELLRAFAQVPATVIAERVGWPYSVRTLSGRVAELGPACLPPDPASRTAYAAGEIAQDDFWFPGVQGPAGSGRVRPAKQLPVLTMVRVLAVGPGAAGAVAVRGGPGRRWWQLIEALGAVPRTLVRDGEGAAGRRRGGRAGLTADCRGFGGTPGSGVYICQPGDPEADGLVGRFRDYLERWWLPGRAFASPAGLNARLSGWVATVSARWRRHLQGAPADRIGAGQAAMIALPPVAPATGWCRTVRLPRDHYAAGQQRLLGGPGGDRPPDPDHRGPVRGSGDLRRADGGWSRAVLGAASR
jgi:transposase